MLRTLLLTQGGREAAQGCGGKRKAEKYGEKKGSHVEHYKELPAERSADGTPSIITIYTSSGCPQAWHLRSAQ